MLLWHNSTGKEHCDSACDPSKGLYRMNTPLAPDAVKVNRYSLPAGAELTYGACFGSWYSFALLDHTGRYLCLPSAMVARGLRRRYLHTSKGPDVNSTCAEVTATAKSYGRISECRCESHGHRGCPPVRIHGQGL